jgi:hypothetical protein
MRVSDRICSDSPSNLLLDLGRSVIDPVWNSRFKECCHGQPNQPALDERPETLR